MLFTMPRVAFIIRKSSSSTSGKQRQRISEWKYCYYYDHLFYYNEFDRESEQHFDVCEVLAEMYMYFANYNEYLCIPFECIKVWPYQISLSFVSFCSPDISIRLLLIANSQYLQSVKIIFFFPMARSP